MHHGEGEHGMERARDPTMHHGEGEHGMQRARDPEMHHGEGEHSTDTGPAPPEGFVWGYDSSKSDSAADKDSVRRDGVLSRDPVTAVHCPTCL